WYCRVCGSDFSAAAGRGPNGAGSSRLPVLSPLLRLPRPIPMIAMAPTSCFPAAPRRSRRGSGIIRMQVIPAKGAQPGRMMNITLTAVMVFDVGYGRPVPARYRLPRSPGTMHPAVGGSWRRSDHADAGLAARLGVQPLDLVKQLVAAGLRQHQAL